MKDFEVIGYAGDMQFTVEVKRPFLSTNVYYVFVDHYLQGQVVNTLSGWKAYFNKHSPLCYEDGLVLCNIIEKNMNNGEISPGSKAKYF